MEQRTSLDKALLVIDEVSRAGRIGVRALAQQTGMPPSTIHRILATLVRHRYLIQDPHSREYWLSLRFLELGARVAKGYNVIAVARPYLKELVDRTGETSNLVVFDDLQAVYIDQASNNAAMLRIFTQVGARAPLYCSGVGKAFLAEQGEAEAIRLFQRSEATKLTPKTITNLDDLLAELARIRRAGYAVDNEEIEPGVRCVAAAIRRQGQVVAAISVSGPTTRITPEGVSGLGEQVMLAATRISGALSGLGDVSEKIK